MNGYIEYGFPTLNSSLKYVESLLRNAKIRLYKSRNYCIDPNLSIIIRNFMQANSRLPSACLIITKSSTDPVLSPLEDKLSSSLPSGIAISDSSTMKSARLSPSSEPSVDLSDVSDLSASSLCFPIPFCCVNQAE